MREAHKANYTSAVQFITARMAQINSANINAPGPNPRRISEGNTNAGTSTRTEFNGVDIRNPFRTFTEREMTLLGQRGQAIVDEMKQARRNNNSGGRGRGRGWRGRGHGGYGRGGRGYRNRDNSNNNNNDGGANANGGGNRNVNEATSNGRASGTDPPPPSSVSVASSVTQPQASTGGDRGGQNGSRFGGNRP